MQNDAADLIAGHINATYPDAVWAQDVRQSVAAGFLLAHDEAAKALLIEALFTETAPALLVRCATELEQPLSKLIDLYLDCKAAGGRSVTEWEMRI